MIPGPADNSSAQRSDLAGTTIDRYKLEAFLGAGGMGRVYSAMHTVTRRRCALKLLPDELCKNPDFISRFQVEAQTLARLNHANIVQIYSGGESQARFFLEMEYIDGGDLQKRVTDYSLGSSHGLPEAEVIRITEGILSALEYAHQHGVIHRDLKPANILLSKEGNVKVSDFGLAAVVGEEHHRSMVEATLTSFSLAKVTSMETIAITPAESAGSFAGTILYMSPQALRAEPPDARDDLFSLGVVVYYMLTGKTPAVNYTPVSRVRRDLTLKWDPFIATCLAEERGARYASATAAKVAFANLRRARPKWIVLGAVAAALLVVPASAVVLWKRGLPGTPLTHSRELQSVRLEPIEDRPLNSSPFTVTAESSSGLPVKLSVVSGPAEVIDDKVMLTGPGQVVLRALQAGDAQFAPSATVERSFRVLPAEATAARRPQSLAIESIPDQLASDAPLALTAQSDSGLPVKISVVSGPASLHGDQLRFTGPGRVTLRFSQPGDTHFSPADPVEKTFTVVDPWPERLVVPLPGNLEMTFARVPAGRAMLGSPEGEIGREPSEALHPFSLEEGFLMQTTEVTQAQYEALVGARPSYYRSEWQNRPVEQVRWTELGANNTGATAGFFPKLNRYLKEHGFEHWEATLPSEDEWEYACRAGSASTFNNNTDLTLPRNESALQQIAVYGQTETSPVATKAPNAWGLYDLHGNVAEWTREGTLRGGSFRDDPSGLRSAARFQSPSGSAQPDRRFGFRVVLFRIR